MSFVIEMDNEYRTVKPKDRYWSLQELQDLVGGYIERVPCSVPRMQVFVNEDGLARRYPTNQDGTRLAREFGFTPFYLDNKTATSQSAVGLVGPVTFIDTHEMEDDHGA
jgi:hypothetical protein